MHTLRPYDARPLNAIRRRGMIMKKIIAVIMALMLLCEGALAAFSPFAPWMSAYNQHAQTLYVPTLSIDMLIEQDDKDGYYSFLVSEGTYIDLYYTKDNTLECVEVYVPVENVRARNIFTACMLAADTALKREDITKLFEDENVFYHKDDKGEYCYQALGDWIIVFSKYAETKETAAFVVYSAISSEAYNETAESDDKNAEDGSKDTPEDEPRDKEKPEDDGGNQPQEIPAPTPVPDQKVHKL